MPKTQFDHTKQRGVYKCGRKFKSQIQVDGKQEYLGIFDTRQQAADAYDVRALQFGRTEHLNYNTRGGDIMYQQDLHRVMSKRILGATLIGLTTKRQRLVHILLQLQQWQENKKGPVIVNVRDGNTNTSAPKKEVEELLMQEAEDLLQAVDASHDKNASWPLQLVVYFYQRAKVVGAGNNPREITWAMYRTYFILGLLNSFISISRMIGLTTLPPTIYVIAANSEIIFEALLTYFYLNRTVSRSQFIAVLCVISGVAISLYTPSSIEPQSDNDADVSTTTDTDTGDTGVGQGGKRLALGVGVTLLSRMASALNTVLADKLLGEDRKTYLGVLECSLGNALVPSVTLPLLLLAVPEYTLWPAQLDISSRSTSSTALITLLFCSLCLGKYIDRVSKFYILGKTSTLFFAVIDANMKILAGVGAFVLFGETIFWPKIVGFIFIALSLVLSVYEKLAKAKYNFNCVDSMLSLITKSYSYSSLNSSSYIFSSYSDDEELGSSGEFSMQPTNILYSSKNADSDTYISIITPQCDGNNDDNNEGDNDVMHAATSY